MKLSAGQAKVVVTVCFAVAFVLVFALPTKGGSHASLMFISYWGHPEVDVLRLVIYIAAILVVGCGIFAAASESKEPPLTGNNSGRLASQLLPPGSHEVAKHG